MKPHSTLRQHLIIAAGLSLLAISSASAQDTRYWDSNGATSGFGDTNGTWGTSAFWSSSSAGTATPTNATTATNDTLHFGTAANSYGIATRTVTVSGTKNVGTIIFGNGTAVTTNLSGGTLNFGTNGVITNNTGTSSATAGPTITSAITGFTTLTINGTTGFTTTTSPAIPGSGGLILYKNSFSGTRTINIASGTRFDQEAAQTSGENLTYDIDGRLRLRNDTGAELTYEIGELTGSGSIAIGGGGTQGVRVVVGGKNIASTFDGQIAGSRVGFTKEGNQTLILAGSSAQSYTLSTVISGGTLQLGNGGAIAGLTATSGIQNDAALIYNHSNDLTVDRTMTGSGTLEKLGDGILTLTGTNSYTGATAVNDGTLIVNSNISTSLSTTVSSGATLGGTGTVGTLAVSGILAPGTGSGDIQTLDAGTTTWSVWNFDLSNNGNTSDKLNITGDFVKGTGSGFVFDFMGSTPEWNTTFTLAEWNGAVTGFTLGTDFTATGLGGEPYSTSFFTLNSNSLIFTAIPEPGAALLGGLGLLMLLRRRR